MKKIISTFTILFFIISANAQIKKGTNAFGANFDISYNYFFITSSSSSYYKLNIQPIFEHFIKKNLSIGVALNYSLNKESLVTD